MWAADVPVCPFFVLIDYCYNPIYFIFMPVRKRADIKGRAVVFITTAVTKWKPIFHNDALSRTILNQLEESAQYFDVSIIGYVLMPSHFHALLGFNQIEKLSKFMQTFKSLSSRKIKEIISDKLKKEFFGEGKFNLWRPRFDDLIITSNEQFNVKLNYIHNNPVKDGLIKRSTDWSYSSAKDWLTDSNSIVKVDKSFMCEER